MQFHNGLARVLYFCLPACQLNLDDRLPTTIPRIFWRYSASHVNPSFAIYGSSFLSRLPFARIAKWKRAKTRPALPTELTNSNEQGKENKKMTSFFVSTSREGGLLSDSVLSCYRLIMGGSQHWVTFFFLLLFRRVAVVISETYHLRKKLKKAKERVEIVAACCWPTPF